MTRAASRDDIVAAARKAFVPSHQVDRLLKTLEMAPLPERTLVVYFQFKPADYVSEARDYGYEEDDDGVADFLIKEEKLHELDLIEFEFKEVA